MATPRAELEQMFEGQRGAGETLEFDAPESDVEDTDDGGAIVKLGPTDDDPAESVAFYTNLLAPRALPKPIDVSTLDALATNLIESIDEDIESRKPRDQAYEEGLKRTGIAGDAPGGANFQGAAKTTHPMITKAAVDFEARAIKEIFPPGGPAKAYIPGEPNKERLEKAERKTRHMNWQLTKQIPEFRGSLEKLLTQVPMAGVQYQRWVWDARKKRPVPNFAPVDQVVVPYAADDFYTAERRTFWEDITQLEFDGRVRDGVYVIDERVAVASMTVPEHSAAGEANLRIEGKEPGSQNRDGLRRVYEVDLEHDFSEWDDEARGEPRPYIVRICKESRKIIGVVRNWERTDKTFQPMPWIVEWPFIPWRGAMSIGIAQMIAGLSVAATGALRALLDSGHVNNIPTIIKLKGVGQGGQTLTLDPTVINELDGAMGVDDIRKLLMAVPFNEPSLVLYQLLGFLVEEARDVVRTTFEDLAEQKKDMPVGTTLALIEQGMAVMSAIHGRLYAAMGKTLEVLHRINRMYITDDDIRDQTGELLARRSDYQGPEDVIPVADPRIFSEVQRFAQMQVVADRAEKRPALYNQRKVELMILERLKFPNPEQLLVPAPDPQEMNAVNENVAASLGRPVTAFPEQDHLAHIQAHLDYLQSPFFGMLQPIAVKLYPAMIQHLIEHVVLWYASRVWEHASQAANQDFSELLKFKDPETRKEIDRNVALASSLVIDEAARILRNVPQAIQRAMQVIQSLTPQQPQDPQAATKLAVENARGQTQREIAQTREQGQTQRAQLQLSDKQQDRQATTQQRLQELRLRVVDGEKDRVHETQENAQQRRHEQQQEALQQAHEDQRNAEDNQTKILTNTHDNETALAIAEGEIQSAEKVAVSTGTGIDPGTK